MKLCIVYNFAQKYREGIYKLFEQKYDCHWVFGNNASDIKGLDLSLLKSVETIKNRMLVGPLYYQEGVPALLKSHDTLLLLGELFCLSTWIVLLQRRLFMRSKRVYLWSHGWYGKEGFLKKILKRWFFSMSDATFLYGQYAKDVAQQQGYTKNNLYVVHNSLDHEAQVSLRKQQTPSTIYKEHFGNERPTLIFIGRLTKVKRLDLLLQALGKIGNKYNLVLVGDGEARADLEQMVDHLGLRSNVWFYGACYDEVENAQLVYNADLCVSPGNVGLTAVHALTYGTPVITNNNFAWQMPEFEAIQQGVTGDFFEHENADSLAQCIQQWFQNHGNHREQVRQTCYNEIDNYWTPSYQMSQFKSIIG